MAIYGGKKKDIDAESEPYSMDEDLQGLLRATDGFHEVVTVALGGEAAAIDGEQCQYVTPREQKRVSAGLVPRGNARCCVGMIR